MVTKAKANPFSAVEDPETEAPDTAAEIEGMGNLGDAAQQALSEFNEGDGATQDPLDGTDYLKVKFMGMSMDSLEEEITLGTEMTFVVRARCIGNGTDISKTDGHQKRFVKMDVQSVKIHD